MGAVVVPTACVRGRFRGLAAGPNETGIIAPSKIHIVAVVRSVPRLIRQRRQHSDHERWRPDPRPFPRHKAIHVSAGLPLQAAIHGDGARYLGELMQHLARPIFWLPLRNPHSRLPAQTPALQFQEEKFSVEKGFESRTHWGRCSQRPQASSDGAGHTSRALVHTTIKPPEHRVLQREPRRGTGIPRLAETQPPSPSNELTARCIPSKASNMAWRNTVWWWCVPVSVCCCRRPCRHMPSQAIFGCRGWSWRIARKMGCELCYWQRSDCVYPRTMSDMLIISLSI
ncbi:hypothetical protein PSPO01_10764 [Paraphaeosphaeria sporulosa]